jgi:hypothetical protein
MAALYAWPLASSSASAEGMIVATKTSAEGAPARILSIKPPSRAGASDGAMSHAMSFVPTCSKTVRGFASASQALMPLSSWWMKYPVWPSWSRSPRVLGPLDPEPTKSTWYESL